MTLCSSRHEQDLMISQGSGFKMRFSRVLLIILYKRYVMRYFDGREQYYQYKEERQFYILVKIFWI